MAIDYSVLAIPKGKPRSLTKGWKRRERDAALEKAYEAVDARDKGRSRVSGLELIKGLPGSVSPALWLTRHHMRGRSTDAVRHDPKLIFTCSGREHEAIESGALLVEGDDADGRLVFHWNRRLVPVGKEPFKIRSKRRTQHEG